MQHQDPTRAMPPLRVAGSADDGLQSGSHKPYSGLPPWAATVIGFVVGLLLIGGGYLLATQGSDEDLPASPLPSSSSGSSTGASEEQSDAPTPSNDADQSSAPGEPESDAPDSDQSDDDPDKPTRSGGPAFPGAPGGGGSGLPGGGPGGTGGDNAGPGGSGAFPGAEPAGARVDAADDPQLSSPDR